MIVLFLCGEIMSHILEEINNKINHKIKSYIRHTDSNIED